MIIKHQKEQTVTRLKKAYSVLSQTSSKAFLDYGNVKNWELVDGYGNSPTASEYFAKKYVMPYLSIAKDCGNQTTEKCDFSYSYMNSSSPASLSNSYYRFYLNDGSFIAINSYQDLASTAHKKYAMVIIDINGQKKPNKEGRDVFEFDYMIDCLFPQLNGKLVPKWGHINNRTTLLANNSNMCNKNQDGKACAALIMKDGWRIADDYPW